MFVLYMSRFTHLHSHSHYSLLQALPKVPDLVKKAKKDGMGALALTDNGNLYGAIEFYKECKKDGIKPIIGVDLYVASRSRHEKQTGIDSRRTRLVLLAKNLTGYKNLLKLVTDSYLEGFYYKPRIDAELIEKYGAGLLAIMPAINSPLTILLQTGDTEKLNSTIEWYKKIFGDDFYLEITHHDDIDGHKELMEKIVALGKRTKTPLVANQEVYYLNPEDKIAQRTLMLVSSSGSDSFDRSQIDESGDFSFISAETANDWFKNYPEALENSGKIADKCDLELTLGEWAFPDFKLPPGTTPDDELRRIVFEGFKLRNVEKTKKVIERVEYELSVIKGKKYSPYFLIVADLIRYAREHNILSNIRGSVSGSMVTYLARITNIDPIEFEIPFERFLNPDRPSAPDIDMDFADNRRDEIIEYTRQKYGHDKVAQIGTFGTMAARGSVRDVTRALGLPVEFGDKIAKLIPFGSQGFPMTLDTALETTADLKKLYDADKEVKRVIDMARKIEGSARHIGVHAAGVVISPTALTDFTPLQLDPKGEGKVITQYDMYSIDENGAGLLKFDFLGLKNLSIIADTLNIVEKIRGEKILVDDIPMTDKKTFEMLARGETADLFQLNGDGMTRFLKELKPTTIHDINAMVALYRPGPLQFIPVYIECKHDKSKVKYLDPSLKPILEKTYGVLVYQDDLLMIAHKLAGYTWGEVDKFRKAVGKKIPKEMAAQKEKFIEGCIKHSGWKKEKAEEIWKWIEPFAAYGFNKAHSVSYGRVAYQTAYLKANFPGEYMASVLTHESGDVERVAETVVECKRMKIEVLPPSVNESFGKFTLIQNKDGNPKIRFGLNSIKNFGEGVASAIIAERKKTGKFKSLTDFLARVKDKNLNKKSLEALIMSGAMDEFEERGKMYANIEVLLTYVKERANESSDQNSLFGASHGVAVHENLTLPDSKDIPLSEKLFWEKELLGLYVSGHPLDKFKDAIQKKGTHIKVIKNNANDEKEKTGEVKEHIYTVAGIIESIRPIMTKKNEEMCFIKFADLTGFIDVVIFPRLYRQNKDVLIKEACIVMSGKVSERNGEISMIAESMMALKI